MNNVKYTGTNIAAAVLILLFFFPWVSELGMSFSGFELTKNGISPGITAYFVKGSTRLFMLLSILVPLSAGLILYQNISGNKKFDSFYKPAHYIPFLYLAAGIIILYFKMKPDIPSEEEMGGVQMLRGMRQMARDMAPGAFDVLGFAVYLSVAAGLYIMLVNIGKIKDKEYYKPTAKVENIQP